MTTEDNLAPAEAEATQENAALQHAHNFAQQMKNLALYPYRTEKSVGLQQQQTYTFVSLVPMGKDLVKLHIEHRYAVKVKKIGTVKMPVKTRVLRSKVVKRAVRHKYYVVLQSGYALPELSA